MGGRPKALLTIDGETFLARVVRTCREGGCDTIWVVAPPPAPSPLPAPSSPPVPSPPPAPPVPPEIAALARESEARVVVNPDPARGMFSSAQIGIRAAGGADAFLLFAVDHPRVRASTVRALLDALAGAGPGVWLRPAFEGHGGHPILVPGAAADALLARDPSEPLRNALRGVGRFPQDVPVDDPGIHANLNRPEQLAE